MKKLILTIVALCAAGSMTIRAADAAADTKPADKPADKGRPHQTEEQKAILKDIRDKYDANKDGTLDKEERAKITTEDKDRMEKAGIKNAATRGKAKGQATAETKGKGKRKNKSAE